jgi:hypothetical protein
MCPTTSRPAPKNTVANALRTATKGTNRVLPERSLTMSNFQPLRALRDYRRASSLLVKLDNGRPFLLIIVIAFFMRCLYSMLSKIDVNFRL